MRIYLFIYQNTYRRMLAPNVNTFKIVASAAQGKAKYIFKSRYADAVLFTHIHAHVGLTRDMQM